MEDRVFARRLRDEIKAQYGTLAAFAREIGMAREQLSRYVGDNPKRAEDETLLRFARGLRLDAGVLFGWRVAAEPGAAEPPRSEVVGEDPVPSRADVERARRWLESQPDLAERLARVKGRNTEAAYERFLVQLYNQLRGQAHLALDGYDLGFGGEEGT